MLKEIHDQPISVSNALSGRISADGVNAELGGIHLSPEELRNLDRINLVACGSAFYASLIGASYLREYTNLTVEAFKASEFPHERVCSEKTLTIGVSQSGETKDTIDALHAAKVCGSKISSFCNVIGSTMSRFAGNGSYLHAGPEFSVASTKAFTNMVAVFLLLALTISESTNNIRREVVSELRRLPNVLSKQLLEDDGSYDKAIEILSVSDSAIFIGRGISYPLTMEGALKMMEVAYLPCLAYSGGELKHGPIALIEEGTPVIAISPNDATKALMESSIRECKSRGARIILVSDSEDSICELADVVISTQTPHPDLSPIVNVIPLQIMAYKLAVHKGTNVDRPRNLAKSVTVV